MKIQSPWMGRIKGSAGNMTGCKVYDKNVLRAKAFEVSNPNTQGQKTQRSFFAQVTECCASVTEEQLRSLFGVKPKSMSRRNALTKQISEAYKIDGTNKTIDFSKLLAIGNGIKFKTTFQELTTDDGAFTFFIDENEFDNVKETANIIIVAYSSTTQKIYLFNTEYTKTDGSAEIDIPELAGDQDETIYGYVTTSSDESNVYGQNFGSFTIKTRAEK